MMAPETVVTTEHNKPAGAPPQQQGGLDWLKFDVNYFKTPPGLLKIIQLVLGILCMSLASAWYSRWFVFVAVASFIITLLWSGVFLFSIRELIKVNINWVLSELISTSVEAFMYLIAFIVLFSATATYYGGAYGSNVAAAVFGIFNTVAYAASAFLLFKEHRASTATAQVA